MNTPSPNPAARLQAVDDAWAAAVAETLGDDTAKRDASDSVEPRRVCTADNDDAHINAARPADSRYEDVGLIGKGGAGEVRRMLDRSLNRVIAVKILRDELARDPGMVRRFMHEAQVVAQLDHPSIIPVHELGQLPDGRWYLTMKEIVGQTLRDLIADLHEARGTGHFVPTAGGWTFRRLVEAFRTVCEAIGYAHSKGVIHRDLKPDNVMIGDFGEVYVVDWGLALVPGDGATASPGPAWDGAKLLGGRSSTRTEHGVVVGTPAYMPPEQARGLRDEITPQSDVWALGALFFAVLYGQPPFRGDAETVLKRLCQGPPVPPQGIPVPPELADIWRRCMRAEPAARYESARELAADIDAWLQGSRSRELAMSHVEDARRGLPELTETRMLANRAREKARASLVTLRRSDKLAVKEAAWALEDQAEALAERLDELYQKILTKARNALTQVPDLPEARTLLADLYRERAEAAELSGDDKAAREFRALLGSYDDGRHAAYLRSDGELWVSSTPAGAQVHLFRYETRSRRLVPRRYGPAARTPIEGMRLPVGNYLLEFVQGGRAPVRYPIRVQRKHPWRPIRPGTQEPAPVALPRAQEIRSVERFVPAGWFLAGGDPQAVGALPRRRIWVGDFAIAARPVTFADYAEFLGSLHQNGEQERLLAHLPRLRLRDGESEPLYSLHAESERFVVRNLIGTLRLEEGAPVIGVNWHDAQAYCLWLTEQTGLPWRLPSELEREKASRGVDARAFPWGERADPSFHCMQDSALAAPGPPPTGLFAIDQSPYGVFGLAGGVQEWCADVFRVEGPLHRGSRAGVPDLPSTADTKPGRPIRRTVRGGAWNLQEHIGRAASRSGVRSQQRVDNLGFRICRTVAAPDGQGASSR